MGRKPSAATLYKRSLTYPGYILDNIIPYMESISDNVKEIFQKGHDIDKSDWEILKSYAVRFCELSESVDNMMNTFNINRIKDVKYKKEHSSYYNVVAYDHVKYAMNKLNTDTGDNTSMHQFCMYNAALHIFFYVICPEKI